MTTRAMKLRHQIFGAYEDILSRRRSAWRDLQRSLHVQSAHPDVTKMSQLCVSLQNAPTRPCGSHRENYLCRGYCCPSANARKERHKSAEVGRVLSYSFDASIGMLMHLT